MQGGGSHAGYDSFTKCGERKIGVGGRLSVLGFGEEHEGKGEEELRNLHRVPCACSCNSMRQGKELL